MSIHDVFDQNWNPAPVVDIVQGREYLQKELNFHHPELAAILLKERDTAIKEFRKWVMMNSALGTVAWLKKKDEEGEMRKRLDANPNDEEAKKYFAEKERRLLVREQYLQVMQAYPEGLTRVLMLYIDVKINNIHVITW